MKRGQGARCFGFLSADGEWAHCSREDHAGQAKHFPSSNTYAHRARGKCPCGVEHAPAMPGANGNGFGHGVPVIDQTYDYHDADGNLVFQCVRFRNPKTFRQRRPNGTGGWVWDLKDVERVLYRLPELRAADHAGVVIVAEGEKDVDRLRKEGLTATCNPMGAGKWRDKFSEELRGRHVVILPDNDQVGRDHADQVARSVHPAAASVKVVTLPGLPEKGDASDFLDGGGTVEQLGRLIEQAPHWTPAPADGKHATAGGGFVGSVGASPPMSPEFQGGVRPLKGELLEVHPLPHAIIPLSLRDWLMDIAKRGCFPLEYPAAAALVALSSLVGRNLVIRPKRKDSWTVVPNLWGAIVGPPGLQKTPAVEEALLPLRRLVAEAIEAHAAAERRAAEDAAIAEARAGAAKKELAAAAKRGASEDVLRALAAAAATVDVAAPAPKRYVVNDATVEKLGELLRENPRGLLQFRDELTGFFRTMDRQGHESDRGFYLETWGGNGAYTFDRIGRGTVHVSALCLSVFGTIQPGPLARYLKGAAAGDDADGFMPRFQVTVYPDPPGRFVNTDCWPDKEAKDRAVEVFRRVDSLNPAALEIERDEDRGLYFLHFDDAAQGLFDEWREALENRLRGGAESALMTSHLAKYRSLMPSLALIFHVVESAGTDHLGPVPYAAAEAAAAWCEFLESHARRVYQSAIDGDPEVAARLGERIRQSLPNPFTFRQVANKGWAGLDTVEDVRKAVGILEDRNWAKVVVKPPTPAGGRPSEEVWINPVVLGPEGGEK